jgi:transcriptional regulator with XRE-family HTH domain
MGTESAAEAALLNAARLRRGLPDPELRRIIRRRAGLSQAEVGAAVGVDAPTVCRWESGSRNPRQPAKDRYAALLARLAEEVL